MASKLTLGLLVIALVAMSPTATLANVVSLPIPSTTNNIKLQSISVKKIDDSTVVIGANPQAAVALGDGDATTQGDIDATVKIEQPKDKKPKDKKPHGRHLLDTTNNVSFQSINIKKIDDSTAVIFFNPQVAVAAGKGDATTQGDIDATVKIEQPKDKKPKDKKKPHGRKLMTTTTNNIDLQSINIKKIDDSTAVIFFNPQVAVAAGKGDATTQGDIDATVKIEQPKDKKPKDKKPPKVHTP